MFFLKLASLVIGHAQCMSRSEIIKKFEGLISLQSIGVNELNSLSHML